MFEKNFEKNVISLDAYQVSSIGWEVEKYLKVSKVEYSRDIKASFSRHIKRTKKRQASCRI